MSTSRSIPTGSSLCSGVIVLLALQGQMAADIRFSLPLVVLLPVMTPKKLDVNITYVFCGLAVNILIK